MEVNEYIEWRNAAHDLISKLCETNQIKLSLRQSGFSGHMQLPEIWALEKPVPLTPETIAAIKKNPVMEIETINGDDGKTLYAKRFSLGGGWTRYEEDIDPKAKFIL